MSLLTQALDRILKVYTNTFSLEANLNPGLSISTVKKIAKNGRSIQLPSEIIELYRWRNGCQKGANNSKFTPIFDLLWGFKPLENLSLKTQPSPYEYDSFSPFYSLNLFFSYESFMQGYIVFDDTGETQWVEFGEIVDGFYERNEYYTTLTNMISTITASYEQAYYKNSHNHWIKNEEISQKIWYKYNSSQLSESTLNQFIENPSFNFLNQLLIRHIQFLDPTTNEPLNQIIKTIQTTTKNRTIQKITTKILEEDAKQLVMGEESYQSSGIFSISKLLKEYWKMKDSSISEFQIFCMLSEEQVNSQEDIKQLDRKRREQNIKKATIFILFLLNAVNALIQALELNDLEVRKETIWALGEIRDSRAIEAISQFTEDKDFTVRETAQAALLKLGVAPK